MSAPAMSKARKRRRGSCERPARGGVTARARPMSRPRMIASPLCLRFFDAAIHRPAR